MDVVEILERIHIPRTRRYISVSPREGEFLHRWVKEHRLSRTLEVGLAFGTSASCIMSAHESRHTCIDPFQENYDNLGLENLTSLGYRQRLDFHAGFSHDVLPRLVAEKRSFDFAFIDGDHRFDGIFIDFFYIDLLLQEQGYVLFHDAWMRGTQLVASFIHRNRRNYLRLACPMNNMILFQKTDHDQRPWHHFREFYTWKRLFLHRAIVWMMQRGFLEKFSWKRAIKEYNRLRSRQQQSNGGRSPRAASKRDFLRAGSKLRVD